jgi:hypothetical protein
MGPPSFFFFRQLLRPFWAGTSDAVTNRLASHPSQEHSVRESNIHVW